MTSPRLLRTVVAAATGSVLLASCSLLGTSSSDQPSRAADKASGTVTVWDYYGSATPLKPALEAFEKANPTIKVDYQAYDYDTMQDKFSVAASSGEAPDLATIDMTWIPTYAANGVLSDLSTISGGTINGKPIEDQYSEGALSAMTYDDHYVAALYDFDAYALYYRKDVLKQKHLTVPKTWDQLRDVAKAMAEDTNGDGKADKYAFQVLPDTFHYAQLLLQNGGQILDGTGKAAAFDSPAGVAALDYMKSLLTSGGGIYWGPSQGDSTGLPGINDGRIGMFVNGPYMMGVLKDGAKKQSGKWGVAPAPYSKQPGSYLGGTGLVVPRTAKNPSAAWKLAQFLLEPDQQALVYTAAGAAPATLDALASPALTAPDPYFGGVSEFPVFQSAMATATPFPYVAAWPDIDTALTDAVTSVLIGQTTSAQALEKAAQRTERALAR
ncbi:sugar ABC transporter substrate-binding protein [Nocardioides sp.]|uniref:ABC transporter substrate-binding protein n=1 Tax=Nocardioides sp. TaxID=35761 RepID=UPI0035288867